MVGFLLNGLLTAGGLAVFSRLAPGFLRTVDWSPNSDPSAALILGFVVVLEVVAMGVWGALFWRGLNALRRMTQASVRLEPGASGEGPTEGLQSAMARLESTVQTQSGSLLHSEEQQRLLISDVAHELCSPLARMQRALSLAERHASLASQPYMQKVEMELQHITRLVEETLCFSKISALPDAEPVQQFDLGSLMESVVSREASEVEIERHIPDNLVLVSKRSALDRAVANLVRNAVRYAGSYGPIEIRAYKSMQMITIMVMDSGPGLPSDLLEKIFQPFYRPDVARQRRTGGAGLGLAIVRSSVEACGGCVSAKLRETKGLVFEIQLPATLSE